jgi:hypothetical protein
MRTAIRAVLGAVLAVLALALAAEPAMAAGQTDVYTETNAASGNRVDRGTRVRFTLPRAGTSTASAQRQLGWDEGSSSRTPLGVIR